MQSSSQILAVVVVASSLVIAGCSINVKKSDAGADKNVDIETPFGGIHVKNDADVRDTGLPVYPGAQLKPKGDSHDEKSANVDISTSSFGLKVVALEYLTDAAPSKVIAYYRDQLKKYGNVLECRTEGHGYNYTRNSDKNNSEELTCEGSNSGSTAELKVGTKNNQHIVAIEPQEKGSDFSLVYVRIRGKEGTI